MVEHCDVNAMQMPSVKTIHLKSWHALTCQSLVTSLVIALNLYAMYCIALMANYVTYVSFLHRFTTHNLSYQNYDKVMA